MVLVSSSDQIWLCMVNVGQISNSHTGWALCRSVLKHATKNERKPYTAHCWIHPIGKYCKGSHILKLTSSTPKLHSVLIAHKLLICELNLISPFQLSMAKIPLSTSLHLPKICNQKRVFTALCNGDGLNACWFCIREIGDGSSSCQTKLNLTLGNRWEISHAEGKKCIVQYILN